MSVSWLARPACTGATSHPRRHRRPRRHHRRAAMPTLESPRLLLRDATAEDLPALLPVYLSNPAFVSLSEGSRGEAGYCDLRMLQRDWHIASLTPGRHMLGLCLKAS